MSSSRALQPSRRLTVAVLVGALAAGTGILAGPRSATEPPDAQGKPQVEKAASAASGAALLAAEKGKFRILLDGQPMGSEEFQISPDGNNEASATEWTAHGTTEIRLPSGASAQVTARLKLRPDGTPLRYEWSTQGEKKASATVEFQGGTAKMTMRVEGAQPFLQELSFGSPRIVILDNNVYHHYAILARLYNWGAGGAQTFPVLIPQDMTPGSITVESLGPQEMSGATLELLRMRTADLEVDLYLDAGHRLVRLAVPASKAEVRRE